MVILSGRNNREKFDKNKFMGITTEQENKIKNLDKLTPELKKALLEDTQRAGFNTALHQCRVMFDLIDATEKFNKATEEHNKKLIILTRVIAGLTLLMLVGLAIQIWLALK